MLELMRFGARFYYVLHKNSIGHLLRTSRDLFRPLKIFRKEMDYKCIIFCVHLRMLFVEFVVLLTKMWHTNIDLCRYS